MIENEITAARLAEKELRYRFDRETEARWARESAGARAAIERAVWAAREDGMPISKIAAAYGTKNRGTIYEILRRVENLRNVTQETAGDVADLLTVEPDEELRAEGYPDPWRVSVNGWPFESGRETGWVTFTMQGDKATIRGYSDLGSALHRTVIDWNDEDVLVKHIKKAISEKE